MADCRTTYDAIDRNGNYVGTFYTYVCSRCGGCYLTNHKAVLFQDGEWRWKCKDGKFREVIDDGRTAK